MREPKTIRKGIFQEIDRKLDTPAKLEVYVSTDNTRLAQILNTEENGNAIGEYLIKTPELTTSLAMLNYAIQENNTLKTFISPHASGSKKPELIDTGKGITENILDKWILYNNNSWSAKKSNKPENGVVLTLKEHSFGLVNKNTTTSDFCQITRNSFEDIYIAILNKDLDKKLYVEMEKAIGIRKPSIFSFSRYKQSKVV